MNSTLKVSKYLLNDIKKGLMVFYGIILSIVIFMAFLYFYVIDREHGEIYFGGFGLSSYIFMFVSGLNCFKVNFKFLQANNISRRRFYLANIITFILVSALMAFIDTSMTKMIKAMMPYESVVEQLYQNDFFLSNYMWSFALLLLAAATGWGLTMLYYRCNNLMKTVISLAPVLIVILLVMLNNYTKGAMGIAIMKFFTVALGFTTYNPYMAVLSFLAASAGAFLLCGLLIRKITIKD